MKSIILCVLLCLGLTNGWTQAGGSMQGKGGKTGQAEKTWRKLSATEFEKLLVDTTIQLMDVRTAEEYKSGHIPGAKNIDVRSDEFSRESGKLDLKRPVAVYCRSGVRSTIAATQLTEKGFKVFELEKGINSWTGKRESSH